MLPSAGRRTAAAIFVAVSLLGTGPTTQAAPQDRLASWRKWPREAARAHAVPAVYARFKLSQAEDAFQEGLRLLRKQAPLIPAKCVRPACRREYTRLSAAAMFRYALESLATLDGEPQAAFVSRRHQLQSRATRRYATLMMQLGHVSVARAALEGFARSRAGQAEVRWWLHALLAHAYRYEARLAEPGHPFARDGRPELRALSKSHLRRATTLRWKASDPLARKALRTGRWPESGIPSVDGAARGHTGVKRWAALSYNAAHKNYAAAVTGITTMRAQAKALRQSGQAGEVAALKAYTMRRTVGRLLLALDLMARLRGYGIAILDERLRKKPMRAFHSDWGDLGALLQAARRNYVMYQKDLGNYPDYRAVLERYIRYRDPRGRRSDAEHPAFKYLYFAYSYLEERERLRDPSSPKAAAFREKRIAYLRKGLALLIERATERQRAEQSLLAR